MVNELRLIPLGGLGRIGLNLMLLEVGDADYILDCGMGFPKPTEPGAESVLPDLSFLASRADRVRGIILTHGHEDHIGGVPHVARRLNTPVFGPPFALALIRRRMAEMDAPTGIEFHTISPESKVELGEVSFEFVRVTHSIPDCLSLVIRTPIGTLIHTGDWKIDPEPVDGEAFDSARFSALGDEGVLLLLSDSTNAEVEGRTRSEREVGRAIEKEIMGYQGRVIVSLFSSNVHRLNLLAKIASSTGRSLCLVGRSLQNVIRVARDTGITDIDPADLLAAEHLASTPDESVLVCVTGTQGEPLSALRRASEELHPILRIKPGDRILHSARIIPGHEADVFQMFANLNRLGAEVIHSRHKGIHASGHAKRDELKEMLERVRPRFFLPVHGELGFLRKHAALADEAGVELSLVAENGEVVEVSRKGLKKVDHVSLEPYFIEGEVISTRSELQYRGRVQLAYNGAIAMNVVCHRTQRDLSIRVAVESHGLYTDGKRWIEGVCAYVEEEGGRLPHYTPAAEVEEACRMLARRYFKTRLGCKPVVMLFYRESEED